MKNIHWILVATLAVGTVASPAHAIEPQQSARLERAKDLIAEEQWERAIEQLKAASADGREKNRDEALFWLAHSQHQSRDMAAAIQTISELEKQFPASRWVHPARSLRIEIAQKLGRRDVLWMTASGVPLAPVATPPGAAAVPPPPGSPRSVTMRRAPAPAPRPDPASPPGTPLPAPPAVTILTTPSAVWIQDGEVNTDLRIQALGRLIRTDAPRVIPMLREIALGSQDPREASRAVFVLAQSGQPEAQSTVLEVARVGNESVRIAAVKELGRFGGPNVSDQLLQVYLSGNARVKYEVVNSLGERSATSALLRIAETEADQRLQETAIVRLGQAGAREQLQRFYTRARPELRLPIVRGLFNARADEELIRIYEQEKDETIRREALTRLRLLGTARARAFVEKQLQNR